MTPSASTANDLQDWLQNTSCPICGPADFDVVRPADYPKGADREAVLSVYSSSSDHRLMDQLVACRKCGLVYTNPRIKDELIQTSYSEAVDPVFFAQNDSRIKTFVRSLRKLSKDLGIPPSMERRVLDIGCGGGAFVKAAKDVGFAAQGIEPSRWLCARGREMYGIDLLAGTLADHPFPERSFSIISMWDVIEHLTHPEKELDAIHRLLRDDGYLIINYPDYGSIASRLLGGKWPFLLSVHLLYFTRRTISDFLRRHGFDVVLIRPHFQTLDLGYALGRAAKIMPVFGPLAKLATAIGIGGWPLRYNMGQSLVAARKTRS